LAEGPDLDEAPALPQGIPNVRRMKAVDPDGRLQLGRAHHLGMEADQAADNVDELRRVRAGNQALPLEPQGKDLCPGRGEGWWRRRLRHRSIMPARSDRRCQVRRTAPTALMRDTRAERRDGGPDPPGDPEERQWPR